MESNYHDDQSINSSDDQEIDQENIDLGVGRSYECVFCKRGFNTAQALGGHMNIHRKDRARNKPTTTSSNNSNNKEEVIYPGPKFYQQIPDSNYCNNNPSGGRRRFEYSDHSNDIHRQVNLSYATYLPASSSITRSDDCDRDHPQPLDPMVQGDWSMRVNLELSQRIMEDLEKKRLNQEEELDLELRLGYD